MPQSSLAIHVSSGFHYDVAYLKTCEEYLALSFRILDEALRLLGQDNDYRFIVEQVILLEEYVRRFPEKKPLLSRFAGEGRLAVAPGMYVMPDMNIPDGESLFMQARIGRQWLKENLGIEPRVAWIADPWGHPPQLPQILAQAGYDYYVFWRSMRRDVMRNDFIWQGLDGTRIRAHWLARGYGNITFPMAAEISHPLDLDLAGCGPRQIEALCATLQQYGPGESVLLCNNGDFLLPQPSTSSAVQRLRQELPGLRLSTPDEFLSSIDWATRPVVGGEFNSSLQGSFTSNIRLKQLNRRLTRKLLTLEMLAALALAKPRQFADLWKILLKQQCHDIICGTLTDAALRQALGEFSELDARLDAEMRKLDQPDGVPAVFNPLSFAVEDTIQHEGRRLRVSLPPMSFTPISAAAPMPPLPPVTLPCAFENEWYRAEIGKAGFVTNLIEKSSGAGLARRHPCEFGSIVLQVDNGDLWLNFDGPLSGGSTESALTQNDPDPYDRMKSGSLINSATYRPQVRVASAAGNSEELIIRQEGTLSFWRLNIPFTTRIRLGRHVPRIEYETTIQPAGRQYRLRAVFPTTIVAGKTRHEVQYGIAERGPGEHVAQNFFDLADPAKGLAVLNRGIPAGNVHDGALMLSLFRSVAMEYKAPSTLSYAEGETHTFAYAVVPHGAGDLLTVVRQSIAFNNPPVLCRIRQDRVGSEWAIEADNVVLSALRWRGDKLFLRIYEAVGRPAKGAIRVPRAINSYCDADGLEQERGPAMPCPGRIVFDLRPFEVRAYLLTLTPT